MVLKLLGLGNGYGLLVLHDSADFTGFKMNQVDSFSIKMSDIKNGQWIKINQRQSTSTNRLIIGTVMIEL